MTIYRGNESNKCQGIKKRVVKKTITHEDYLNCLLSGRSAMRKMNVLGSYEHDIYGEEINKCALSVNDDK